MTKKKEFTELRKKIIEAYEENEYANLLSNRNRSRSLTVGTAFGGVVEVSMRGDYHSLWCTLQPVEVVEIIEQLAASAGLEIAVRPRQDFATWRGWDTDADHKYWAGAAHWQIKQIKEAEKEQEIKKLSAAKKENVKDINREKKDRIEELIRSETNVELMDEVEKRISEIYESANEEIERLRNQINVETDEIIDSLPTAKEMQDEYDEKALDDTNEHYRIREKYLKDI
jgi:hypothetical protein